MITKELIQSNIPDIKEDQIQPLVELVNNTFTKELQSKVDEVRGSTFGLIDQALGEFGYPKTSGKTTEHLKNVLITMKEAAMDDKTKQRLSELEKTNKELLEQSKNSNPDLTKLKTDYEQKIKLLEGSLEEKDTILSKSQEKHKKDLIKLRLTTEMPKIKEGIGDKTKELHVTQAVNQLIEFADMDENGNVIFRNENKEIRYNAANKNNPYSIKEMFEQNEYFKEIMDVDNKQTGLGLGNLNKDNKMSHSISFSGLTTQMQADEHIEKHLMSKGITKTDSRFQTEFDKIRTENKVNELPTK